MTTNGHESNGQSFVVGDDGSVTLWLGESCIQTTAKQAYHALMAVLLESDASEADQHAAETLRLFLSEMDFASLRSRYPAMAGGVDCRVRIHLLDERQCLWEILRNDRG
ncbi:MAG TPA: hypothetical protein PLJ27_03230 [Polyangiaceae bacterium]|jgi:hypothetical protein|nr:MAG: hypothetical protein BWY17_03275 [Deltaproteobacteria bacterium ADurb.Bin207]HNS97257.1 hypothetical protein [Polyangiaceae bacterium]HNZ23764.1 hypothetical protein [Polyangiaceae bacterium]HOD23081.1 hypothetical protein [Polyangiaceae bacterium]HOE48989.1 hypothetical protein [Polyangiaceae bacterium]